MSVLRRNYLFWIRDGEGRTVIRFGNIDQNPENPLEGPPYSSTDGSIINLRMTFDIEDTINSNANIADINVFNMNRDLLADLQKRRNLTGEFLVSDGEEPLKRIYFGRIFNINPTKQFPDYISTFNMGEKLEAGAYLNKTILGENKVILEIIEDLKISMGINSSINWESGDLKTRMSGYPLENGHYIGHGFSRAQMDVLASEYDFVWNTNNGILSIYDDARFDTPVSTDFIEILPSDRIYGNPIITGLLNTTLDLRIYLNPRLRAGSSIDIKNLEENHIDWQIGNVNRVEFIGEDQFKFDITGLWRMHQVKHFGDTHDSQWETTVHCIQSRGQNNGS